MPNMPTDISIQSKADLTPPNQSSKEVVTTKYWFTFIVRTLEKCKPLTPLKILHFLWHATSTVVWTFFVVYLKKEGIKLEELFLSFTLAPIGQVLAMAVFSVSIDKFDNAKFYLISGILVSGSLMICILHLPSLKESVCDNPHQASFKCEYEKWTGECENLNMLEKNKQCQIRCSQEMGLDVNKTSFNTTAKTVTLMSIFSLLNCTKNATDSPYFIEDFVALPILCNSMQYTLCNLICVTNSTHCTFEIKKRNLLGSLYISFIVALFVTNLNTYRFMDISAQALVKRHDADYGHVRFWANIGSICGPILAGFIVQFTSSENNANYSSCMYIYAVTCLLSACIAYKMEISGLGQGTYLWQKSRNLIKSVDILIFYLLLLVLGTSWALSVTYRPWYLEQLGAESYMFSLLDVLRNVCGVVLLFKSKWALDRIGERNFFGLALFGYAVYQFSYSFLETAWPAVFIELIIVFSYNLLWVAVITHCIRITPKGLTATVNSTVGILHFTMGRFIGGFVGGVLVTTFGGRRAFQIMGLGNLAASAAYFAYLIRMKRKSLAVITVELEESAVNV